MNRILVTGASGFIGSHLVEYLIEQKISLDRIRLLIPQTEPLTNLPKLNFDIVRDDIRNEKAVRKAIEGVDIVYHLAALTIDGGKYYSKEEYDDVNVKGTTNLLNACKDKKIKKIIFFSSIAVYGLPAFVGNIKNWNENQPKNPKEIYGISKLTAEEKIKEAHKTWGLPYVILRPTSVYGPRDRRNLLELYKAIKKHIFFYIGNGENKMDYVFVKDVARAAYLASESKQTNGEYIIGTGKPSTLNEIAFLVAKSINTTIPHLHIPKSVALPVSFAVLWVSRLLRIQPLLFPDRVRVMTRDCYYDIQKAEKELGYKPLFSFEKGSQITGRWLMENKII